MYRLRQEQRGGMQSFVEKTSYCHSIAGRRGGRQCTAMEEERRRRRRGCNAVVSKGAEGIGQQNALQEMQYAIERESNRESKRGGGGGRWRMQRLHVELASIQQGLRSASEEITHIHFCSFLFVVLFHFCFCGVWVVAVCRIRR